MKKNFISILPDEPYKPVAKNNNAVECTYEGPRYLLLRIRNADGSIFCIDRECNTLEEVEQFKIPQDRLDPEDVYQVVLDADELTWEAAYLTGYYTHEAFPDHEEILPDGTKWVYHYDDTSCAVEQPFYVNDMFYEKETGTWRRPRYRNHAVAKRDFWAGVQNQLETYTAMLDGAYLDKGYNAEQLEKIRAHVDFLRTVEEKYKNVDHWKIPFPVLAL